MLHCLETEDEQVQGQREWLNEYLQKEAHFIQISCSLQIGPHDCIGTILPIVMASGAAKHLISDGPFRLR